MPRRIIVNNTTLRTLAAVTSPDGKKEEENKPAHLFPVCVRGLWSGGEANSLVAVGKLNVEKRHQRLVNKLLRNYLTENMI